MQVLFIVLNDTNYLTSVLKTLVKNGIKGATILDSEGMAKVLTSYEDVGFSFGGLFKSSIPRNLEASKTIFTVIHDDKKLPDVIDNINSLLSGSKKSVKGFMFTVPISGIYPIKPK